MRHDIPSSSSLVKAMILASLVFIQLEMMNSIKENTKLTVGNPALSACSSSVDLGTRTKLKIFVYDLPYQYSLENFLKEQNLSNYKKSNCDWNLNVCAEEEWVGEYSTHRQNGGDATLIHKFRRYANRVYDPDDADIFVVPFPHSSMCRDPTTNQLWGKCAGRNKWKKVNEGPGIDDMLKGLDHMTNETKKFHLFLLMADTPNHNPILTSMPLYVSLGGENCKACMQKRFPYLSSV